jgi:hypothetical protein
LLRPASPAPRAGPRRLASGVRRGVAIVGFPEWDGDCHNAAAVVADRQVRRLPQALPAEHRSSTGALPPRGPDGPRRAGREDRARRLRGHLVPEPRRRRPGGRPSTSSAASRPRPTTAAGRPPAGMLATRADDAAALAFCNRVGGQDEARLRRALDGLRRDRGSLARARSSTSTCSSRTSTGPVGPPAPARALAPPPGPSSRARPHRRAPLARNGSGRPSRAARGRGPPRQTEVWERCASGCGTTSTRTASRASLSGCQGIDSALTAALAADALNPGA